MSSSRCYILTADEFVVEKGTKGLILCLSPKIQSEVTFCLFFQDKCRPCELLIPIFKNLAKLYPNVQFTLVNLSNNPSLIEDSQNTVLPFESTPILILYWNRIPFIQYNGDKSLQALSVFLSQMLSRLPRKGFAKGKKVETTEIAYYDNKNGMVNKGGKPIEYNVVCDLDKNICYMTYGELMKNAKSQPSNSSQSQYGQQSQMNQQYSQQPQYSQQYSQGQYPQQNRNIETNRNW